MKQAPSRRRNHVSQIFITILLFVGGLVVCMPFVWMILSSFKSDVEIAQKVLTIWPRNFITTNYRDLFERIQFGMYIRNNLIVVLFSFVGLFFNTMAGFAFAKYQFRGRNVLFLLVLSTMMIPAQVTLIPLYMIAHGLKLTNTLLGISLPTMAGAYAIFLFRQFMSTISNELLEAARLDGAGEAYVFLRVVLPLSKPILAVQAIFTFVAAWNAFLWPLIATTDSRYYTLSVGLGLLQTQYASKLGLMMAGATVMIVPVLIIYVIFQKNIIKGLNVSAIK